MVHNQPRQTDKAIKFINFAKKIKRDLQNKIQNSGSGKYNLKQLKKIESQINLMIEKCDPNIYTPSYPYIIVDSWEHNDTLGNKLLKLSKLYKKLN